MTDDKPGPEETAAMIRARQLFRKYGLAPDADVKTICGRAGISRKTGYQWAQKLTGESNEEAERLRRELDQVKAEREELEKAFDEVRFENEGRKLAWKIHGVDELLAAKKKDARSRKSEKR